MRQHDRHLDLATRAQHFERNFLAVAAKPQVDTGGPKLEVAQHHLVEVQALALQLERALNKIERMCGSLRAAMDFRKLFEDLASSPQHRAPDYPDRIATRIRERIYFLDLARVTHFYAEGKLTYAVADGKPHCVDHTLSKLEQRLDPKRFIRIHRATLLNTGWVKDIAPTFAGSYVVRLKGARQTELTVARNRAHGVKARLGF